MPTLDVSEILSSPELADRFTVLRRGEVVSSAGESVISTTTITPVIGVVGPASNSALERLPDYQYQGKALTVVTKYPLRGASQQSGSNYQPDVILWPLSGPDSYVVADLQDYTGFGAGFVQATCVSIDLIDQAPA